MSMPMTGGTMATTYRPGRCDCCGAPLRTVRGDRRFTLMDGMILVAASAVAFAIVRPAMDGPLWGRCLNALFGGMVALTPAVLLLRLRGPRPTIRRLSRRPGFVASGSATVILSLGLVTLIVLAILREARRATFNPMPRSVAPVPDPSWWLGVVGHFGVIVGPAVIAAWVVLALSGRRRPSRDWLDILGRTLGAAWIVLFVINTGFRLAALAD